MDPLVGLSSMVAVRRRAEYGPNELRSVETRPWWRRSSGQFQSSLIYLLVGAVIVALAAWWIEEAGDGRSMRWSLRQCCCSTRLLVSSRRARRPMPSPRWGG
ncbi:MAG: hypothetical protein IPK89_10090 [Sphingomonadales bacterium]|nr:hypothetical protein [Sphingomonadales bacterium]